MAIVEMKRVSLLGMRADRDKVLRALQRAGCVQITEIGEEGVETFMRMEHNVDAIDEKLSRIRWAIGKLGRYDKKQGMLASMSMPEMDAAEAECVVGDESALMATIEALEAVERRNGELRGVGTRVAMEIEQLTPWLALNIPVDRLHDTRETAQFVGAVPAARVEWLQSELDMLPVRVERVSETHASVCLWIVAHKSARDAVQEALRAAEFSAAQFPGDSGTPRAQMDELVTRRAAIDTARTALEEELSAHAPELPKLKLLYEMAADEKAREDAKAKFAATADAFWMQGWIPAAACAKLEKSLRAVTSACEIEFRDPTDDEQPPTLLRNHRIIAPFEAVVSNYSMPDPHGLDPTFIMTPFFVCFFGMMVSDAGYGLIMAILIPLIIHFVKPKSGLKKIMWILAIGGISTVFWGAMFNTWFGAEIRPILISPLEQPLEMLGLCLGLGVVHLFAALGVGAYMNFKRGKPLDAVFDQFLWVALIVGLGMLVLPQTASIGMVLAIVGAVGILLTAGRAKPNLLGKLTGGFGALYGITSWLSDILSYMRLFGMGLATGVIGMVVNMLAGMILAKGVIGIVLGVVILLVGHALNAAINVLGAYVHACRLQYIEFFGKFYEDGGTPFAPLTSNPRYIAIRSDADSVEQ